ncbi:MAG: hypothetical protein KAS96_05560 [Planctomycetes bacterium]|nr:hypothetical protein [Planctomycetota bacterium]
METKEKATTIADLKTVPFRMKKALIPIDRYAQRELLSRGIVEQCAKVGLLQIRKCKGEVFVVDTPFEVFGSRDEILADVNSQIEQQRQVSAPKKQPPRQKPVNITKPAVQAIPVQSAKPAATVMKKTTPAVKLLTKTPQSYKSIVDSIAEKQLQKDAAKPKKTLGIEDDEPIEIDEIINTEILSGKKPEMKPEDFGLDINEIDELINEKDLLLDYQQSYYQKSRAAAQPQKNWTTAAIISALCLSFSLMCCFWLYLDSQMQREKISSLRMDNVKLQKNVSTAKTQTAGIREEFAGSNRKISELNDQINNLKMELANTKNQLELTTEQLQQATQKTQ